MTENCSLSPVFGSRRKTENERYVSAMFIMMILMSYCFSARPKMRVNSTYGQPCRSGQHEK